MEQLKAIRETRGLSRAKVATLSGLNPATITRIENGERSPTVETLEKLATALDIEVGDFFPKVRPSSAPPGDDPSSYAFGDEVFYDSERSPEDGLELTEYLLRLQGLITRWFRTFVYYNSDPEVDTSAERMHVDWNTYRLEETCRKFVGYLEEGRAGRSLQPELSPSDPTPAEKTSDGAGEDRRDRETRAAETRSGS